MTDDSMHGAAADEHASLLGHSSAVQTTAGTGGSGLRPPKWAMQAYAAAGGSIGNSGENNSAAVGTGTGSGNMSGTGGGAAASAVPVTTRSSYENATGTSASGVDISGGRSSDVSGVPLRDGVPVSVTVSGPTQPLTAAMISSHQQQQQQPTPQQVSVNSASSHDTLVTDLMSENDRLTQELHAMRLHLSTLQQISPQLQSPQVSYF